MDDTNGQDARAEVITLIYRAKAQLKDRQASSQAVYKALEDVSHLLPRSKYSPSSTVLQAHVTNAQKIFAHDFYKEFAEFLVDELDSDWLQPDDSGRRLVELFDRCFLLGPDEDSFLALSHIVASKKLSICMLHCIGVLELQLKDNCLARILQRYCCGRRILLESVKVWRNANMLFERDLLRDPQRQAVMTTIASLPDMVLSKVKSPDGGDFFLPQNYIPFVCAETVAVLKSVYREIQQDRSVSLLFMSEVLGKLSLAGYAEMLWKQLLSELEAECINDYLWRRIMQLVIGGISDRCQESVIVQLVLLTTSHIALRAVLGSVPLTLPTVAFILTHKLILVRCYDGPRALHVLRNVVGYLACTEELSELFQSTFRSLLAVWADASSLRHRPVEQTLYICQTVLLFTTLASPNVSTNLRVDIQSSMLNGLQGYLGSTIPNVRHMGCFVAEKLSSIIRCENDGQPLSFGLEKNDLFDNLTEFCVLPDVESLNGIYVRQKDVKPTSCSESNNETSESENESSLLKEPEKNSAAMTAAPLDSDDDDDDYFADLKPIPVSSMQPENVKQPLYLAQCLEGLIKPDDPESVEQCLQNADSLVRHADLKTISELGVELCRVLLHLDDKFALVNFAVLRLRAMVSVTVMCPAAVAEYLGQEFYARNYSIRHRMDVLDVLASAAAELTEPLRSSTNEATSGKDDDTSLVVLENTDSLSTHWSEIVRRRIEAKTRRFAKGRSQVLPAASASRFAPVAGSFFYPLLRHFDDRSEACLDLLGTDHLLLERLFYALGSIVLAAAGAPVAYKLSATLLDFVRCGRHHAEVGVRRAVLYAVCTALAALPPGAALDDQFGVAETGEWLRSVTERDADSECQKRAAHGLILLSNAIQHEFSIV